MIVRIVVILILIGFVVRVACARNDGRYGQSAPGIKEWINGLKDKKGVGCCDTADGYPAEVEWDNQTGKYRVRIEGNWYAVPDDALLDKEPNRLGYATVWWYSTFDAEKKMTPKIRCFLPGAGG